jgi:hypothetical protein
LTVALIVHGPEKASLLAANIMGMYGETFEDYMQEFS